MWNENDAGRGANEIASAMYNWMCAADRNGAEHIVLYSDTCAAQNRNKIACSMIITFLSKSVNTVRVEQKYFETGHSQMECDSIHSAIENKFRKRDVHLPNTGSYRIVNLDRSIIFDWGVVSASFRANAFNGIITKHLIEYTRAENRIVNVAFADEIDGVLQPISYKKRGRMVDISTIDIPIAYSEAIGVDKNKKEDLLKLCKFMPPDCKYFYEQLKIK